VLAALQEKKMGPSLSEGEPLKGKRAFSYMPPREGEGDQPDCLEEGGGLTSNGVVALEEKRGGGQTDLLSSWEGEKKRAAVHQWGGGEEGRSASCGGHYSVSPREGSDQKGEKGAQTLPSDWGRGKILASPIRGKKRGRKEHETRNSLYFLTDSPTAGIESGGGRKKSATAP